MPCSVLLVITHLRRWPPQGGLANVTESGSLLTQFVTALLASPYTTPTAAARLVNAAGSAAVPGPQASDPSAAPLSAPEPVPAVAPSSELSAPAPAPELPVAAETAAAAAAAATSAYSNWSLSCPVPAGYSAVVPAVLWNVTTLQNGSVSAIGIALAGSGAALARVAVWGVGPAVGPIAGGTNVTIQVRLENLLPYQDRRRRVLIRITGCVAAICIPDGLVLKTICVLVCS